MRRPSFFVAGQRPELYRTIPDAAEQIPYNIAEVDHQRTVKRNTHLKFRLCQISPDDQHTIHSGVHILPGITGIFDDTRADNGKRIRGKGVDRICQPMALIRRCKYKNQSGRCNGNARQNKPPCRKQQAL